MLERLLIGLVRLYQMTFRSTLGGRCRFHPSCSDYAILAIRQNGALRGTGQALWRLVRCAPWSAGGVDYPPEPASESVTVPPRESVTVPPRESVTAHG